MNSPSDESTKSSSSDQDNSTALNNPTQFMTKSQPRGNLKLFNEHDTPPPVLFMQGSCIIEVGRIYETCADGKRDNLIELFREMNSERVVNDARAFQFVQAEEYFIAHVKVVDGSGDMLFRFDNTNLKEPVPLTITYRLKDKGDKPTGELRLSVTDGLYVPANKTIMQKDGDKAMNPCRERFRCIDASTGEELNMSGVQISKDTAAGPLPIYNVAFSDLRSKGMELKIMIWFEEKP